MQNTVCVNFGHNIMIEVPDKTNNKIGIKIQLSKANNLVYN